jgi:hypothetical protein
MRRNDNQGALILAKHPDIPKYEVPEEACGAVNELDKGIRQKGGVGILQSQVVSEGSPYPITLMRAIAASPYVSEANKGIAAERLRREEAPVEAAPAHETDPDPDPDLLRRSLRNPDILLAQFDPTDWGLNVWIDDVDKLINQGIRIIKVGKLYFRDTRESVLKQVKKYPCVKILNDMYRADSDDEDDWKVRAFRIPNYLEHILNEFPRNYWGIQILASEHRDALANGNIVISVAAEVFFMAPKPALLEQLEDRPHPCIHIYRPI